MSTMNSASFIEFYTVRQDYLMSLPHDWGPGDKDKRNPIDISQMSEEMLWRLAFHFGGVGDGHHVLRSIIGLSQARLKLNKRKRQAMQVYLTMNNVHTSALARDLCLLSLLDELLSSQDNQTKVAEVKMTLISLWMGCIMPLYCFTRSKNTIKLLMTKLRATPPQLPDWLFVAPEGIPRIVVALKYWDTGLMSKNDTTAATASTQQIRDWQYDLTISPWTVMAKDGRPRRG